MPKDESKIIDEFNNKNLNIKSSYEVSLNNYKNEKSDSMKASLIVSFVILAISFIEIFLMIRASFLSRIKEIGIYRAIGVKRTDICKMFMGEILAITTITGIPAVMFVSYALKNLMTINFFEMNYVVNLSTILISIIILYIFNIIVGLIPVFNIIRQTPAAILSRKDIDN